MAFFSGRVGGFDGGVYDILDDYVDNNGYEDGDANLSRQTFGMKKSWSIGQI